MYKKLTTTAIMLALSTVLSMMVIWRLPNDGSVTPGSMVPLIAIAIMFGWRWGIFAGIIHGIIQMMLMFATPPVQDFWSYALVVLLDYIVAFGVLGFAGIIYRLIHNKYLAVPIAGAIGVFLRFLCHFFSGVTIWSVYAGEQNAFVYSLLYNGSYLLPELLITVIILIGVSKFITSKRFES